MIRPSAMATVMQCPGSDQMRQMFARPESTDGDEGTLAHRIASGVLMGDDSLWVESTGPEMTAAVTMYVEDVRTHTEGWVLHVEKQITPRDIHMDLNGTCDAFAMGPASNHLVVWEFKYGWGIVNERINWQFLCYASAARNIFFNRADKITFRLVQPRPHCARGRIREWTISPSELKFFEGKIRQGIELARSENPPLVTGPNCRYCSALLFCPAAEEAVHLALGATTFYHTVGLAPEELSRELDILLAAKEVLTSRIASVEERIIDRIKKGTSVPGWSLKNAAGRKKWTVPAGEVIKYAQLFGIDLAKPAEPITPTQALNMGLSKEILNAIITQESTIKLERDYAQNIFGG